MGYFSMIICEIFSAFKYTQSDVEYFVCIFLLFI